jgi:hypothetical protein
MFNDLYFWRRGGIILLHFLQLSSFPPLTRNTRVFYRLLPSLSSRIRLSNAFPSLLWTPKVPQKSNMSNKTGFPSDNLPRWKPTLGIYRSQGQPQGGGLLNILSWSYSPRFILPQ